MTAQIILDLSKWPVGAILGALGIIALLLLLLPVALRVSGLTGQQISDVISLTLQFFLNLASHYRAQNKDDDEK